MSLFSCNFDDGNLDGNGVPSAFAGLLTLDVANGNLERDAVDFDAKSVTVAFSDFKPPAIVCKNIGGREGLVERDDLLADNTSVVDMPRCQYECLSSQTASDS